MARLEFPAWMSLARTARHQGAQSGSSKELFFLHLPTPQTEPAGGNDTTGMKCLARFALRGVLAPILPQRWQSIQREGFEHIFTGR
jgi:hypothetical protein